MEIVSNNTWTIVGGMVQVMINTITSTELIGDLCDVPCDLTLESLSDITLQRSITIVRGWMCPIPVTMEAECLGKQKLHHLHPSIWEWKSLVIRV